MLRHGALIAQDDELHPGSRHRHIHTAEVLEEAYLSLVIGANEGDEDDITILSLEAIHRVHADETAVRLRTS